MRVVYTLGPFVTAFAAANAVAIEFEIGVNWRQSHFPLPWLAFGSIIG